MGEEKRHQMMQNLFGDQSEEEEEEEIESEHESNRQPDYPSDEGEGEVDLEGEGEIDVEKQDDVEVESEGELQNHHDPDPGESEGERMQSSPEREVSDVNVEGEEKDVESDDQEEFNEGGERSGRWKQTESASERSDDNDNEDEEVNQSRKARSPSEEKDQAHVSHSTAEIRDVFGDSDEEEEEDYGTREQPSHRSPMEEEEEGYENNLRPEDEPDGEAQYESEDQMEQKTKERPVGPPLELDVPLRPPPGQSEKMNMIKVSNIMGIDMKPFDAKTYVEEDNIVTDESGQRKPIRLENNIVRWRSVRQPNGKLVRQSNAKFVKWSDGSLQLLIGNEVLDISVQEALHDQAHLFVRNGKGILQSQGNLMRKMRFMPSSLTSNSHRLLTAIVDSRHKKVYKVKNCITDIDPEREKEEKEKALGQTIRANELLNRKRERVGRKYSHNVDRGRQLSSGFLDDDPDEDDEGDYHDRRSARRRRFEEDLEVEAHAEKRIINAKRNQFHRDVPRKSSYAPSRRAEYSESEKEESEYETDGEDIERSPPRNKRVEEPEYEDEDSDEPNGGRARVANDLSEDEEDTGHRGGGSKRNAIGSDVESPPRKKVTHRRMVVSESDDE